MKFTQPTQGQINEAKENHDWTVGAPMYSGELDEDELDEMTSRILRLKNGEGERPKLLKTQIKTNKEDNKQIDFFKINFIELAKLLYEHRRYAAARGFSDTEMDVLRAIEFHDANRVGVDEIQNDIHAKEYSESTIYKALRTLQEKSLIDKVRPGVYEYSGPT